jgi:hypothetical protein
MRESNLVEGAQRFEAGKPRVWPERHRWMCRVGRNAGFLQGELRTLFVRRNQMIHRNNGNPTPQATVARALSSILGDASILRVEDD